MHQPVKVETTQDLRVCRPIKYVPYVPVFNLFSDFNRLKNTQMDKKTIVKMCVIYPNRIW